LQANRAEEAAPAPSPEVGSARDRLRGALVLVASAAVFPLTGLSARRLRASLPAAEITFLWCAVCALGLALASALFGFRLRPKRPRLFLLRGLSGAAVTGMFFLSVQRVPLSTATVLLFSDPIWVALFSSLRGVEGPRPLEWGFVIAAVGGVVLTADPVLGNPGWGEALALLAGIVAAGSAIFVREMRREGETVATVYFAFLLCGTVVFAPFALALGRMPSRGDLPWIALFLAAGTAGNLLMTYGYRFVRVTTCAVLQASETVFAAAWAWVVLGEVPLLRQAAGGGLVVGSVVALTVVRSLQRPGGGEEA
jgi:drug/metabolite transporter (DMT)-like permease